MKTFHSLLVFTTLISSVLSTAILLPLYIYPGANGAGWDALLSAAQNNANVDFFVIVNPDSGPGGAAYPNVDYVQGIQRLNSQPNIITLGYVHTSYGTDPEAAIQANISHYADWAEHTPEDISVDGIFFDETSVANDDTVYDYMSRLSDFAYDTIPADDTYVIFNPGVLPQSNRFYDLCDQLIVFEDIYANYQGTTTLEQRTEEGYVNQAAFLVNQYTGDVPTLQQLVEQAEAYGVGSIYFTADANYNTDLDLLAPQAAVLNS